MVPLTLPTDVWSHVAGFLNVKDAARLSGESPVRQALFLMLGRRSHLHCKVSGQGRGFCVLQGSAGALQICSFTASVLAPATWVVGIRCS